MAKRTIKLNIKLPSGIVATALLESKVKAAATAVIKSAVNELATFEKLAKELSAKGISITPQELLARSQKGTLTNGTQQKAGLRKRIVLTPAQRRSLIADLKKGVKTAAIVKKYGISIATVMNIKKASGLTKKRKK
jgi:hypothetical protein